MTQPAAARHVTVEERRARLARRHRLAPTHRTDDVVAVTDGVVALHSSDPVSAPLSVTARMANPSLAAVESALYDDRSLVRHHAMRRTLWVMTLPVAEAAHATCTRRLAEVERVRLLEMLESNGVSRAAGAWLDRARERVLESLAGGREATVRELSADLPELMAPLTLSPGKSYESKTSALARVLLLLGFEGRVVRGRPAGSWISSQYRWVSARAWLGRDIDDPEGVDAREAAARIALHWLHAFGPGTTDDLRWWTGWTLTATRRALADVGAVEVRLPDGSPGWLAPDDVDPEPEAEPWAALLPGLDPTTMGWKERSWYVRPEHVDLFFDSGNAGPTVWVDGRAVGMWVQRRDGEVATEVLEPLTREQRDAVDRAAASLRQVVGDTRFSVRFPSPLVRRLLA